MHRFLPFLVIVLFIFQLNAQNRTEVLPGDGTLSEAILNAADGDTLVLVPEENQFATLIAIVVDGDGFSKAKLVKCVIHKIYQGNIFS